MINKIKLGILSLFLFTGEVNAQSPGSSLGNAPGVDLTIDGIKNIIKGLACWLVDIALILIVVAVVFYGIQFLISRGDPTKVTKARSSLSYGIVGIIVILGTYTIIASVANSIGADLPSVSLDC